MERKRLTIGTKVIMLLVALALMLPVQNLPAAEKKPAGAYKQGHRDGQFCSDTRCESEMGA
jgi:hypothetical protein